MVIDQRARIRADVDSGPLPGCAKNSILKHRVDNVANLTMPRDDALIADGQRYIVSGEHCH